MTTVLKGSKAKWRSSSSSIYKAVDEGLKANLPKVLRNFLLLQDDSNGENWLENYEKANMDPFERVYMVLSRKKRIPG